MHVPIGRWLVAVDVEALYNSIPHSQGIHVTEWFLSKRGQSAHRYNQFVLELLHFILTQNIFIFWGSHYLQVQGDAMGTRCAPSYSNLYLGGWERDLLSRENLQEDMHSLALFHQQYFIYLGRYPIGITNFSVKNDYKSIQSQIPYEL